MKVGVDFLVLTQGFLVNGVAIDSFHHMITRPTAALKNVLIRNADGVHDTGRVMAQVMEPKIRNIELLEGAAKRSGDLIGIAGD